MKGKEIRRLMRDDLYDPKLTDKCIKAITKSINTKIPLLLHGPPGTGKTLSVYYVAMKNNYHVIEVNASDDLKLKSKKQWLRHQILKKRRKMTIILLDELEKSIIDSYLIQLIKINEKSSMRTNSVIIGITNNEWQLSSVTKTMKLGKASKKIRLNLVEAFGFTEKIYQPYQNSIQSFLRTRKIAVPKFIKRDLRFMMNCAIGGNRKVANLNQEFLDSFKTFEKYMSASISERPDKPPSPQELAGSLDKWLLANAFDDSLDSFVKKNQREFFDILEIISLADYHSNDKLYQFLPTMYLRFGNYKHPSTIMKQLEK